MNIIATQNYDMFSHIKLQTKQIEQKKQNIPEQSITIENNPVTGLTQPSFGESLSFDSHSINNGLQFTEFTSDHTSQNAQNLASLMTEYPIGVTFDLDGMSMEQLANLCGGIGKQIDNALSQGEISEQEYKDLNKGLNAYTEFMTKKAETQKATWSVMRQTAAATRKKIESGISDKDMEDYAKQVKESWENKISMFLEENSYDRITLHQMIRLIREGKSLSFDKNA